MDKYLRTIKSSASEHDASLAVDVYDVLVAFGVACPARAHAIKKLLCAGLRGKASELQDLEESVVAVRRAIDLLRKKEGTSHDPDSTKL